MSPREKKLLMFFGIAGFIIINIFAWNFYTSTRKVVTGKHDQAVKNLANARKFNESRKKVAEEMKWLAIHEPEAAAKQDVQTKLYQTCETEAKASNLTIKGQKQLPSDTEPTRHFHRAKVEISVTGTDQALYQWFDRVNLPDQLRIASHIHVSPNQKDKSQIDCTATVEQWFVPLASSN